MKIWNFIKTRILRQDPEIMTDEDGRQYVYLEGKLFYIDELVRKYFGE